MKGKVYLVGAGPGDPGLLTLRGKELLGRADVVVYDFLAERDLLSFCRKDAELIYVGKKGGCHTMSQEEINGLLVSKAKEGKVVVRLKGGDPFVFGRGGEEALFLRENGVEFEVVPGVTSGVAVPAYAGIPVTHRKVSVSVGFVTGHEDPTKERSQIKWEHISKGVDTVVFLMGMGNLKEISKRLMENGRSPETPSAVITWGTRPFQKVVVSKLKSIGEKVEEEGLSPPGILIVGEVVRLREKLSWFEKRPLFGRRIVVTRPNKEPSTLKPLLEELGAHVVEFPTIELVKLPFEERLKEVIGNRDSWDAVVFTSRYAVSLFFDFLEREGFDGRVLGGKKVFAIGRKTAERLGDFFIKPDFVPGEFSSDELARVIGEFNLSGGILLPRAKLGRREPVEYLRGLGLKVIEVFLYDTVIPERIDERALELVGKGAFDVITFTSSSMVRNFARILKDRGFDPSNILREKVVASIGPVTSKTLEKELGIYPTVEAKVFTMEGLVESILGHYRG